MPEQSQSKNDVRELLKFQALMIHRAELAHALKAESLTAYDAYGICLKLLAAVCGTEISSMEVVSKYRHNNPWPAFAELYEQFKTATPESVERWRFYDLVQMGPDNPSVQACSPDLELVNQGWTGVLAIAADSVEGLNAVLRTRNIRVGAPLSLRYLEATRFVGWETTPSSELLPPIHSEGGVTSFHVLKIVPGSEPWRAVVSSRQIGARYADETISGKLRLKFRLYLKPPTLGQ